MAHHCPWKASHIPETTAPKTFNSMIGRVSALNSACIATHPSDLAVALLALDAVVVARDTSGERRIPLADLFRQPGDSPHQEHNLRPGELIVAIEVPVGPEARRSGYLKVCDRASYEFALASAAVALDIGAGIIRNARGSR